MDKDLIQKVKEIYDKVHDANIELYHVWRDEILFSWRWWLELSLIIVFWTLWILFRKRKSTSRLLLSGFVVLTISSWLDFFGVALGLWYYPVKVIPTSPSFILWDFTLLPILVMFLIQFRPTWHPFVKALLFAGFTAFVGEPLFIWLGYYVPIHWEHLYSFPILFGIYILAYYVGQINGSDKL